MLAYKIMLNSTKLCHTDGGFVRQDMHTSGMLYPFNMSGPNATQTFMWDYTLYKSWGENKYK